MKIALAHYRIGDTDGVSLEMEKWRTVLESMGHEVVFIAGNPWDSRTFVIEELNYRNPYNDKIVYNAFENLVDYHNEQELLADIERLANIIEQKLIALIHNEQIDVIVPNNILSLGWGLSAGIAFTRAIEKTKVRTICHHHDFHWERELYSRPTVPGIKRILETYFPPKGDHIHHVVINKIAQNELRNRYGLVADVVPNVFDFQGKLWTEDQFNYDFRENMGVDENDILILQATRVTERKAIELGIEVVHEIQKEENLKKIMEKGLYNGKTYNQIPKVVYLLAGNIEASNEYVYFLRKKAKQLGVDMRFIHDRIDSKRKIVNNRKIYSLWDSYVHADLITYPSILEGWGNQLLEAVFAKKPTVIFEYPVYKTDIADKNFKFISLGSTYQVGENSEVMVEKARIVHAAREATNVLTDRELYQNVIEHNFNIGKKYYSYDALKNYLEIIFNRAVTF